MILEIIRANELRAKGLYNITSTSPSLSLEDLASVTKTPSSNYSKPALLTMPIATSILN